MTGRAYLVGAGPGDPGLITAKGLECVQNADVIIYDRLVHPSILSKARSDAEIIYAGKAPSAHTMKQEDINRLLVEKAKEGRCVVRLKGGDPFVFGRGGEEAEALAEAGIEFEIVPGVTSAAAAPAYAGIPVTHRRLSTSLTIVTGHEDPTKPESSIKWNKIATGADTIVFLMGVENLGEITVQLVRNGRAESTPAAVVRWGTTPEQQTVTGTLGDIAEKVQRAGLKPPAVIIVGDVVTLREKLGWFDKRPLFGKRVLVTRAREQASALSEALRACGAEPIDFPVIKIMPPSSFAEFDAALEKIADYHWLIFTSANGVKATIDRLLQSGRDIRSLAGPKIGAIGPKTASSLRNVGVRVDYVPSRYVAEAVAEQFPEDVFGRRILLLRAEEAREVLVEMLVERGAQVDVAAAYRTEMDTPDLDRVKHMLAEGQIDIITFTSSSTVTNFVRLFAREGTLELSEAVKIACIGPITARTAEQHGLKPDVIADEHTVEGLVDAMVAALG